MSSQRLISVDVLRGFTIFAMIIVNTPGSWSTVYPPLLHAEWNGCTPTDLVFPFFLIIMGISIPLAFSKALEKGTPMRELYAKIGKRTVKLFLLGIGLNLLPFLLFGGEHLRIPGVLQRIAIVFAACSLCYLWLSPKGILMLGIGILMGYWALLLWVPVPNETAGDLSMHGGLAAWLDSLILGDHVWSYTAPFDPEGILSTFPAIVSGFLGMMIGEELKGRQRTVSQKTLRLGIGGLLFLCAGWIWGQWFPINKGLWTSSYVLYTGGWALLTLSICIFLIDMKNMQNAFTQFFVIFGSNAITVYILSGVIIYIGMAIPWGESNLKEAIYQNLFTSWLSPYNASFAFALAYTTLCWVPMWWLYRRKIFIKV